MSVEPATAWLRKTRRTDRNKGRKSPRWALFTTLRVYDLEKKLYMHRLRIVQTPWWGLYLHRLYGPDSDRALHDHPWWFFSIVLWGQYDEEVPARPDEPQTPSGRVTRPVRWFNFKRATDLHRVSWLSQSPVITLVIAGPRCREWGFQTDKGWVASTAFEDES